jgi:virginiamycin B lyase
MNKKFSHAIAAIFGAAAAGSITTFAFAQTLPNGSGKEVVEMICTACHDLSPIIEGGGASREDWDMEVQNMIAMGAMIKPEQVAVIADYLAQNFPPKGKK